MKYADSILGESVEQCQAAVEWAKDVQKRRDKGDMISKQLMQKYTPLIMERKEHIEAK